MRVGLTAVLDEGWLTFDTIRLTSLSAPISARPEQYHKLAAQVSGQLNSAGDGRLFIQYSNGTIHNVWQNDDVFNGSQNITGNFTTPANVSSFQVGTEVVLDKGHLNFDDLTLTAYSNYIEAAPSDWHRLTAQITGELDAGWGQGGQIWLVYQYLTGQTLSSTLLWSNPADFSGMATMQADFNPGLLPPTVVIRMALETNLDAGYLAFSDFGLAHLDSGDIIRRRTYSVAGQPIAVKVTGDPVNGNNGIFFTYSDHLGSASVMSYGYNLNGSPHPQAGQPVPDSKARYLPFGGWRGAAPTAGLTDRGFTGHKSNNLAPNDIGLIYMNARYYSPYINRFISADTIVPDPTNPQQYNRYSYALNNALKYLDPSGHIACNDPHLPEEGRCLNDGSWGPGTVVYYLNGLGGSETIEPQNVPETLSEYNYILFVLEELYGEESVFHVPVFTNGFQRGRSQLELFAEALGSAKPQTHKALEFILENPPYPGERVVIVGSSAGGTVAVELLPLLKQHEIFVDQLILRGSPVFELSLGNVGRVDYLAGDPPLSDPYYSIDINPFDGVSVHEHVIPGLTNHAPNRTVDPVQTLRNIGSLLVNLLEQ